MGLRYVRLYIIFTVALCALQAIGLSIGTAFQIDFGWPTVVLANFCAAQAVLWSFIRQTGRTMSQTEKLLFAGYATLLTTALALGLLWGADAMRGGAASGFVSSLAEFFATQDLFDLAFGFGVGIAAIVMGLSFGAKTCLKLQARFLRRGHSAGAAKRV